MRNFFLRGKLRKSSDTRSSTSLGSESSESSSRGGSLSPTAGISVVVSDLSNSPSESSNLTADNSPDHTTHPSPKIITHKRAFSDEASQITAAPPQPRLVVSLKAQSGVLSQSSLCINGSHVYAAEPMASGSAATLPATLGLLQKCSPLSRSLQNLTRRSDDPQRAMSGAEGRRWSFDKAGKEEKAAIAAALEQQGRPVQATAPLVPVVMVAEPANEGKKPKRNIFSHGRSESAGRGSDQAKVEQGQPLPPAEEKHKGWFGSKDSHNKPSSPLWSPAVSSSRSDDLSPTKNCLAVEHTVGMARQEPLQGALGTRVRGSPNPFVACSMSENPTEWDESFEAFAASRLGSQKGPTPSCPPEALSVCIMNALPLETPMGQTSEVVKADENNAAAENASPALPQRPTKIPVLESRQNHWFNWTQEAGMKKDSYLPPQNEMVSAEHTKEEERCGKELIPSQEDTIDTGLFSERGPQKPSNSPVSSLPFMSTCSLMIKNTNTVKPTTSPLHKHLETSGSGIDDDRVRRLEDDSCAGRENDFTGNASTVSGKEVVDNTVSLPEVASEESKIHTYEPEGSLTGTNQFFDNILMQIFSESLPERTDITVTAPEQIYETVTEQISTNTNEIVDALQVPHVPHTNLYHSCAHLIDFPNSVFPNTDTTSLLPVTTATDTEINNNTNELTSVLSHSAPERIMSEINFNRPGRLFTEVLEFSSPAQSVDCPNKVHSPSPFPLDEALLQCVPGDSISAAEVSESGCFPVSMAPLVVSAGSSPELVSMMPGTSVQTDIENILGTTPKGVLERGGTYAYETLEPEQTHTPTEGQDAIPQRLGATLFTDITLDITLKECIITFDAPSNDLNLNALATHPENVWQENRDEEPKTHLNVKEPSGTSNEDFISRSTLISGFLEVTEPGPPMSPVPQALTIETLSEDPDSGNPSGTCSIHSAEINLQGLPVETEGNKRASSSEEVGCTHSSYCMMDSSTAVLESPLLEIMYTDHEVTQPPPKPPRLFQESFPHDQCMNESPQPGLGDFFQTKDPSAPEESPIGFFQIPKVSSDPVTSQTHLPSECSDLSVGIENGQEKSGDQRQKTFTIIEDEPSSGKGILQSDLSAVNTFAFGEEENSDRSWLTNLDYFKIKELDTSHLAVWSVDQENPILTDSTCLDKALLMSNSLERETSQVPDARVQLTTSTYSSSRSKSSVPTDVAMSLNEGLGESWLHQLKSTKQQTVTERVESVWFPLPSVSSLSSTISQDLIMDLMPADFCRPQDKKECLEAPRQGPLNPEPFLQLHPHNLFSEFNIDTPPEGITAAIIPEGLHANAVPSPRSHPPIGGDPTSSLFLHDCNPQASSTPFLLAETNAQFAHFPSPIPAHMLMRPTTETTQASSTIPPSKAQPMIGTTFAGLPQETQPAAGLLPSHQSSPHPVKPLTTTAPQEEKKSEGRSVLVSGLEKLKSTIHPGRAAHQGEPETDRNKQALSEGAAPYYHLTHNELVSLLLQREAELERQQAEFERQGVLLEKRELEVKKMKVLIRDLEDYIDTLLVRIMEQTPTLLQVRSKLK